MYSATLRYCAKAHVLDSGAASFLPSPVGGNRVRDAV